MARDFQTFLKQLESAGELRRVAVEVGPYLEMAAIVDRVCKQPGGGTGLYFERPKGHAMPVAMNVFGSLKRMEMALGVDRESRGLDAIADRIEKLAAEALPKPGSGLLDKLAKLPVLGEIAGWMPKTVRKGLCQEIVLKGDDVKLSELPVLTTWPEDGGPFITLGLSHVRYKDGRRNMGLYRLQVYDDRTLGFHTQLHHDGAKARHGYAAGERMPLAVSFGGDPALTYAATAPLPPMISEVMFTGFLRGEGVEMVKCVTHDLEVPADSEIVIEGWVDPGEVRREGPFGDHTGYYSLADDYPVLHVEAITMRKNPVFPATIVGRPPQEDAYLGLATERIFLPLLRLVLPEIRDMHLPAAGAFHNLVILSMKKEYPGHPQKVMNAIWGTGQIMFTKGIVIVDEDIDPHDLNEVLFRLTSNVDPRRDMLFTDGPLDVLDHSSDRFAFGSKVGIDATRKNKPFDDFKREWPRDLTFPDDLMERVNRRWKEYGL
ncbi:MAG: menaquinone biosynthesis decarboxylase [Firmicutes bacterium]|nr:menaquinone biosynthesis decarboxylase [Bacillota bacterium]